MVKNKRKSVIKAVQKESSQLKNVYTVLVPIQDPEQFSLLLPPAIDLATKNHGKVILLNVVEIPYQLPPSSAKKFITERELMLEQGLKMLELADCSGSTAVRIAHNMNGAIKRFAKEENVDTVIKDFDLGYQPETLFCQLKSRIVNWF